MAFKNMVNRTEQKWMISHRIDLIIYAYIYIHFLLSLYWIAAQKCVCGGYSL